jgi:hypothetical protein
MNEPQEPVQDAARQPSDALPTDELDDEDHRPIPMSRARIARGEDLDCGHVLSMLRRTCSDQQ